MRTLLAGSLLLLSPVCATAAPAPTMRLGEVLVLHAPDLEEDADAPAFEAWVVDQVAPAWTKNVPGMTAALFRKDRGNRSGRYLLAWTTDTRARHRDYASATGDFPFACSLMARALDFRPGLARFVQGRGRYVEYHLVGPETVGALPEVEVLGLHYASVRPERREAFDRFVAETLHPAVGNLRPDLRLLYYKPVRGDDPGRYVTVFALTRASRDRYWPDGQDSDDLRAAFDPSVAALADDLRGYLVEGSYATGALAAAVFESREWVDWVLVPPADP